MSYGYQSDYVPLNKDEVLKRASQEEIFKLVFGQYPEVGVYYTSPLRTQDTNPGCFFEYFKGKLWFVDFAHPQKHFDCFNMLQYYYNLTFYESLMHVNQQLQLGLDSEGELKPVMYELPKQVDTLKHSTDIIYKSRPFSIIDGRFWLQYGIEKDDLMEDNVFAIVWYKLFSSKRNGPITIRPQLITYAYSGFEGGRVKIYTPEGGKGKKWVSNCIADDVGNIDNLPLNGKRLIITKAYKDCRVLRNFGINSVWFQNEGTIPNNTILVNLCRRFDNITVLFDNDNTGRQASEKVVTTINSHFPSKSSGIFIPEIPDVKDTSDMYKEVGKIEVLRFLTLNNLI